jgi:hypothetical protein
MKRLRLLIAAAALAGPTGCALVGFDLGDYGGDGEATVDGGDSGDVTALDGPGQQDGLVGADGPGDSDRDGGADATDDTGGADTGQDGTTDAGRDAPGDAPTDSPKDTGVDTGTDSALPPCTVTTKKRVFVSSTTYPMTGVNLVAADMNCNTLAAQQGILSPNFAAWLSDESTSAGSRIKHNATDSYVLMDAASTLVACNWAELASSTHRHGIDHDESGALAPTSPMCGGASDRAVWTGTNPDGAIAAGSTCVSWTSTAGNGAMGLARASGAGWTGGCAGPVCGGTGAIYCIEHPP